jgi:hypothetical protein
MSGSCIHCNALSGSIKGGVVAEQCSDYQLLRKESALWSISTFVRERDEHYDSTTRRCIWRV